MVDQTTNATITRKLLALSKLTMARKKMVVASGLTLWTVQTYERSKALTPQPNALNIKEGVEEGESIFAEIPAISEGVAREKFLAIYRQPKWKEGLAYARKTADCLLTQTGPTPLTKETEWVPYFSMWETELGEYLVWLRKDFTDACDAVRISATRQRNISAGMILVCVLGLFVTAQRMARSIARPLDETASKLAEGAAIVRREIAGG